MSAEMSVLLYLCSFSASAVLIHMGLTYRKRTLTVLGVLIPTFLGGLRYGVGADYFSYVNKMSASVDMGFIEFSAKFNNMEPSLWILGRLSHVLFDSGVLFFFVTSFLTTFFLYLAVKRFGIGVAGLAMFLLLCVIFSQGLSGVRQGVAIAVALYAFSFIASRRIFTYLSLILLACMFHYSAFVLILIYPLYHWVITNSADDYTYIKRAVTVFFTAPFVVVFGIFAMQFIPVFEKYSVYINEFIEKFGYMRRNILPELGAFILLVMVFRKFVLKNEFNKFVFLATAIMFSTTLIGLFIPLAGRFSDYFMSVFLLAMPCIANVFDSGFQKRAFILFTCMFGILFFIGSFYINGSGDILPYMIVYER